MKINDSLYFDLIIYDPHLNECVEGFLTYQDLITFKMVEHTGAAGIVIECCVKIYDNEIKNLFIQNNMVGFYIGESKENSDFILTEITEVYYDQDARDNEHLVSFASVLSVNFLFNRISKAYKGNSLEVLKQLAEEYFKIPQDDKANLIISDSIKPKEITKNNEPMSWLRTYSQGNFFMQDVWLHMDLGEKRCPIIAIRRDKTLIIKDINEEVKLSEPKCYFTNSITPNTKKYEIVYLNDFKIKSYKFDSNLFMDFGTIINIKDIETGKEESKVIKDKPDLASTKDTETSKNAGYKFLTNKYQSSNVHKTYKKCYYRNLSRLIHLCSFGGNLHVSGYISDINVLDIVNLSCGDKINEGRYIVDTKTTTFGFNTPIKTTFYICRDNRNFIENYVLGKGSLKNLIESLSKLINDKLQPILESVRNLRRLIVMGRQLVNGYFLKKVLNFLNSFKYNLLTSFSLFGVTLNFNNVLALMNSLKAAGNSLVNQIINAYIPYPFNYALRNYAIERPSFKTIMSKLLSTFSPAQEFKSLLVEINGLLADLTGTANDLYNSSYKAISISEYSQSGYSIGTLTPISEDGTTIIQPNSKDEDMNIQKTQTRIQDITNEFIANTEGIDIPIVDIKITESESLLPDYELKELVADKTILYLTEQGYLYGVDNFKDILLGVIPIDYNTINKINENVGNMLYARYWGTFKNNDEITDFFIKNSYKDIYVTIPTTKIINALKGAKVFIALPQNEKDLVFYLNNKEVEMDVLEGLDIGLYTISGYSLLYNVYMSKDTFHSNSVVLEVRQNKYVK